MRRWCRLIHDIVLETLLNSIGTSGTHQILFKLNFELFHAEMMAVGMEAGLAKRYIENNLSISEK